MSAIHLGRVGDDDEAATMRNQSKGLLRARLGREMTISRKCVMTHDRQSSSTNVSSLTPASRPKHDSHLQTQSTRSVHASTVSIEVFDD